MSAPKNREELIEAISFEMWGIVGSESKNTVLRYINAIEALGVRLVPAEPTKEMIEAADLSADLFEEAYQDAILASHFASKEAIDK